MIRRVVILLTLMAMLGPIHGWGAEMGRLTLLADVASQAITLIKDRDGFLWIGTYVDGVYRYDGKRLTHYTQASGLIRANSVPAILEDVNEHIWFAAAGGGLSRFDKETNRITFYGHDPGDPGSLSTTSFFWSGKRCLAADPEGYVWIGTIGGGLNRWDPATETFSHYRHEPENPESLSSDNIRTLLADSRGALWIGTENGLNRLDRKTGRITRFMADPEKAGSLSGPIVMSVFEDSAGRLWVGTESNGLNRFDRETETFVTYRSDPQDPSTLGADRIIDIFEDTQGTLWLSHQKSMTYLDPASESFRRRTESPLDVTLTLADPETGATWILTDSGQIGRYGNQGQRFALFRPDPENPNALSSEVVVTIYADRRGILWIATLGGLNRFDPVTGNFTVYRHVPGDRGSIPSTMDYTPGIFEDSRGTFWIGSSTPAALSVFDRDSGRVVKTFRHQPDTPHSLPDAQQVNRIIEDRNDPHILWLATAKGLVKFDRRTERFTTYGRDNSWTVTEDERGRLWIATWGNGLGRFDRQTETFVYYRHDPDDPETISDNALVPVFADSKGRMWVGTENGLNRFDPQTGRFRRYDRSGGYPWDAVHSIGEDRQGNLWLGTNNGLARFDPQTGRFRCYSVEDGIQGAMFYANNGVMTPDGRMWFGGTKGMNAFDPSQVKDNPHIPPVRLTAFKQGGVEIDLRKAPERLEAITLDWQRNFFEFEFAAFDYTAPEKNQDAYRLEGVDKGWYAAETRNFGRYVGLSPGTYTLRLRGSNNDGIWNERGQTMRITVLPPFWRTGWFYTLIATMAALGIGAVIFYMLRLNREIAERRRAEQGLVDSNARLENLNRELKRLDQLKDEFLANTSHELRTPLVGIIGLAESLIDGATGPLAPKTTDNLAMIVASGRRLANLVDDILDFSKLRHRDINLSIVPVDLYTTADVVLAITHPLVAGKQVQLLNLISPETPPASADENRIQQILFNLVGNAVKFTEVGMVSVSATVTDDGFLEVCVADTGIGIPEDRIGRVFASFEQVDGSIERQYGGTGLGLAVTQQLVELHGGTLRVTSTPQKGSQFFFTLPISREERPPANETPKVAGIRSVEAEISAAAQPSATGIGEEEPDALAEDAPTILVVDDEPVNLRVLANHLSLHHYRVTRAANGFDALNAIDRMAATGRQFDLVLLDVMMPRMSGYEVCKRLRETYPPDQLPVVMLTAKNRVEDLVTGLEAGANDYLTKPFSKSELLARIKNHSVMKHLVDERLRQQLALRESEKRYRELFESIPDVIYRVDASGRLAMISPAVSTLLGYSAEAVLGKPVADKLYLEPEQQAAILERLRIHGPAKDMEIALKHKNGTVVWVSLSARLVRDASGSVEGIEGIFRDITSRKTAEENLIRLSTAVEQAAELIFITDARGHIQYVNPAFQEATGYTPAEVIGKNPRFLKSGKHDDAFYSDLWHTVSSGRVWKGRLVNRKKDGSLYEEDATISPIRNQSGAIVNYVAIKRDITRETALESQLVQSQKMESIGTLAGGIAHDFNNILSAIIGYTEISLHDAREKGLQDNLLKVLEAGERARELVNQILTFSRQSAVEPRPVKVRLIVKEALKLLRASLPTTIDIATDLPSHGTVMADPTQIHQVLMNLCTNAAHAMGETGGTLRVGLHDTAAPPSAADPSPETPGPWLLLTVADTGHGMDAPTIKRIFDPFFTTKEKGEGTGMGLSVVHGIVTGCGGRIDVTSQPGAGTTFKVYLPAIDEPTEHVRPAEEPLLFGTERILLVDDEPFQVDLGKQVLERLGYRVVTETTSTAALERFRGDPDAVDLVITDMTMPQMRGDQLARELLALRPDLPVILCTGYSEHITETRAAELGIRGFALKPMVMKEIARLIRRALDDA